MKKVFVLLLMLVSILSYSQDSITILKNKQQIENINLRLDNHVTQYKTGTTLIVCGGILTTLTYLTLPYTSPENLNDSKMFMAIGSLLMTTGIVIQIDSHKHFNKTFKKKEPKPATYKRRSYISPGYRY